MVHKSDIEILFEFEKDLFNMIKQQDKQIEKILDLVKNGNENIFDLIKGINNINDTNIKTINRQGNLIIHLFDEINRLNRRIDKLETQVKAD